MGKKIQDPNKVPTVKKTTFFKKNKKNDNKELYAELATHQEEKIISKQHVHKVDKIDEQQQQVSNKNQDNENQEFEITDISKQLKNSDRLSQVVTQLLIKNKVNSKNAFEIPLINLEDLSEFQKTNTGQAAWKKLSSTLESDYKIYSFRVDSAHSQTYRILSSMNRTQKIENQQVVKGENKIGELANFKIQPQTIGSSFGIDSLEKNLSNINIDNIEYAFSMNPYYEKTKRNFDQGGVKGLLLNNLKNDLHMRLMIEPTEQADKKQYDDLMKNESFYNIIEIDEGRLKIFDKIKQEKEKSKKFIFNKFNLDLDSKDLDIELDGQLFVQQVNPMNVQELSVDHHNPDRIIVQQEIKMPQKNIKQKLLSSYEKKKKQIGIGFTAFQQDAAKWMTQTDMRFTKMRVQTLKKKEQINDTIPKNLTKNIEQYIQFNQNEIEDRKILKIEENKRDLNVNYQNYHLLPMNTYYNIDFLKTISVKEVTKQTIEQYEIINENQNAQDIEVIKSIENKKTQTSIKQIKEQLKKYINIQKKTDLTFQNTFNLLKENTIDTIEISIQSCFITFLHLANENNYALKINDTQSDFIIINQ